MNRLLVVPILVSSLFLGASSPDTRGRLALQEQCSHDHRVWVGRVLQEMHTIQPGMTRKDLLEVFTTEGGLSTGLQRTYVSRECEYFKIDVEFEAVGRPGHAEEGRVTLDEDDRDVIVKISRPYLDFSHMD
ncbi:MAG TPA: hypothetical protein VLW54_12080 [Candidatus Acidoferrales bacterium]|nr:hypothetical protein [Candidatus Acidoferrales bacterium]